MKPLRTGTVIGPGALILLYTRNILPLVVFLGGLIIGVRFIYGVVPWTNFSWGQSLQVYEISFNGKYPEDDLYSEFWEAEYESRKQRVRDVCGRNKVVGMKHSSKVATNRGRSGQRIDCDIVTCPLIAIEPRLLFCFTPKVATTRIKRFFLNVSVDGDFDDNDDTMHIEADDALTRISTAYHSPVVLRDFYRVMFVRHPFDRLVSAYRSKALAPRSEKGFFYNKYWDPIMLQLRPYGSKLDHVTFEEFVWYLTQTPEREYDIHWTPYWSRCDPCFVDYDFIGKLESSKRDFPYAFRQAGLEFEPAWWDDYPPTNRSVTFKYFASIKKDKIRKLYDIYRNDFELFGYSVDEFLPGNNSAIIVLNND